MYMFLKRRDFLAVAGALAAAPVFAQEPAQADDEEGLVRVRMTTQYGEILIGAQTAKAPVTAANFLRYVDANRYDGAQFYRALKSDTAFAWGLIQGGISGTQHRPFDPIAHEPTTQTGLKHTAGSLSYARNAPGSATSEFFICVGDMTALDADPAASGDNLGYAVFGRVLEGMDVVRLIQQLPTSAEAEVAAMANQMLVNRVTVSETERV
jgi:peptidyl-prolyl cis-trans isomerase A (cyclophilin A)